MPKPIVVIRVNKYGYPYGNSHGCTNERQVTLCNQAINARWQIIPDGFMTCYECLAASHKPLPLEEVEN